MGRQLSRHNDGYHRRVLRASESFSDGSISSQHTYWCSPTHATNWWVVELPAHLTHTSRTPPAPLPHTPESSYQKVPLSESSTHPWYGDFVRIYATPTSLAMPPPHSSPMVPRRVEPIASSATRTPWGSQGQHPAQAPDMG
ncbi:hypothetical protein P171DRAFT_118307 [Karstenula rhodostoma CBS 690.94]|uniref:Uncharacterized protein n=1 Tax=Karstenula rhodostoma CBS 690.94 TaxID=1392251 RepID=A0A9P4PA12_9PLEO|nr:hypothetical protein P171DRAFT_118307 [Karstenula rhodostoma CBS 690.94]